MVQLAIWLVKVLLSVSSAAVRSVWEVFAEGVDFVGRVSLESVACDISCVDVRFFFCVVRVKA